MTKKRDNREMVKPNARRSDTMDEDISTKSSSYQDRIRLGQVKNIIRSKVIQGKLDVERWLQEKEDAGNGFRPGMVLANDFVQVLVEKCDLELGQRDLELLVQKFGDYRGVVNCPAFVRFLEILPPRDHVDPELKNDRLPQPYRMLVKILDEDIVDGAWDIILKRNPSLNESACEDDDEIGQDARSDSRQQQLQGGVRRTSMNQTQIEMERKLKSLEKVKKKKQKIRQCCQNMFIDLSNVACVGSTESMKASFVATTQGMLYLVSHDNTLINASEGFQVFEEEKPISHIACVERETGVYILAVVSSRFAGSQEDYEKELRRMEEESGQGETAQMEFPREVSEVKFVMYSALSQPRFKQLGLGSSFQYEDAILDVWIHSVSSLMKNSANNNAEKELNGTEEVNMAFVNPEKEVSVYRASLEVSNNDDENRPQIDAENSIDNQESTEMGELVQKYDISKVQGSHVKGFYGSTGKSLFLYRYDGNQIVELSTSVRTPEGGDPFVKTFWMPANILCSNQFTTKLGTEFAAFGLRNGCAVVWNVRAGVVRAILRHQLSPCTSIAFYDLEAGEKPPTRVRSESTMQILCGCANGKVYVYQLTSDAPAAAAILPRVYENVDLDTGDIPSTARSSIAFEDEAEWAFLTGAIYLTRLEQNEVEEKRPTVDEQGNPIEYKDDQIDREIIRIFRISNLPLWVGIVRKKTTTLFEPQHQEDEKKENESSTPMEEGETKEDEEQAPSQDSKETFEMEVHIYDVEVGAQIGRLRFGDQQDWSTDIRVFLQNDNVVVQSPSEGCFFNFWLGNFVPAFYPSVARACGVNPAETEKVVSFKSISGSMQTRAAKLTNNVRRLLLVSTSSERCDTRAELGHYIATSPSSEKQVMISQLITSSPPASPSGSILKSPKTPIGGGGLLLNFSAVGNIAAKIRARRDEASKNVINPTRLDESLVEILPAQRAALFEEKRRSTRENREELLTEKLNVWRKMTTR